MANFFVLVDNLYTRNILLTFQQQQWQQWPLSAFQLPCDITPLPPHNRHLSTTATFLCPQSGCCEDQARLYSLKFVGSIFAGE